MKDATSQNSYDVASPWLLINLASHGYGDTVNTTGTGVTFENLDPQGSPLNSNGLPTPWVDTWILLEDTSNYFANPAGPACTGSIYTWPGAYAAGLPGNGQNGSAFVQDGFSYGCPGTAPEVFAVAVTTAVIECPKGGATNFGATDDYILPNNSGVSASPVPEYKGCFVPASTYHLSTGSQTGFDIHTQANGQGGDTLYMGVNINALFSTSLSTLGLTSPFLASEVSSMSNSIGSQMNAGLQVNAAITASEYYDDVTNQWHQLSHSVGNNQSSIWQDFVLNANGTVAGPGAYCDRQFGYYGGWNSGYPSSYLLQTLLYAHCNS